MTDKEPVNKLIIKGGPDPSDLEIWLNGKSITKDVLGFVIGAKQEGQLLCDLTVRTAVDVDILTKEVKIRVLPDV